MVDAAGMSASATVLGQAGLVAHAISLTEEGLTAAEMVVTDDSDGADDATNTASS